MATSAEAHTVDIGASYQSSLGHLVALFRARGISIDEAQDLAHETILRVLIHVKRHGRARDDLGPLARTIARNLMVERLRKGSIPTVALSDAHDVIDDAPEPSEIAVDVERREAVREALRTLSPRHRRVVELWMQGLTPADIARELGIKRNAADAVLHRARRTLATKLRSAQGAFGAFGVISINLKRAMRRIGEFGTMFDPSTSIAGAATTLAAVGIAAVLSGPPSATSPALREPATSVERAMTGTAERGSSTVTTSGGFDAGVAPIGDQEGPEVEADVQEHRASAETRSKNPATGEESEIGVDIYHLREQDRGISGPLLDDVTGSE
ncbi:MAG: sigma-70 family RNA polymerase sigma factor [Actinomycetota bacterium]